MPLNYVSLKSELALDPSGLSYSSLWNGGRDAALADFINLPRSGLTVFRGVINGSEIAAVTTPSEYTILTVAQQNLYNALVCASGGVDSSSTLVRTAFSSLFTAGSQTRAAITALASRQASRAEIVFGQNISSNDVAIARKS